MRNNNTENDGQLEAAMETRGIDPTTIDNSPMEGVDYPWIALAAHLIRGSRFAPDESAKDEVVRDGVVLLRGRELTPEGVAALGERLELDYLPSATLNMQWRGKPLWETKKVGRFMPEVILSEFGRFWMAKVREKYPQV